MATKNAKLWVVRGSQLSRGIGTIPLIASSRPPQQQLMARWHITTYLNDNAQTPLNRFVVYMLYSQHCNKYSDKSNRWYLGISHSMGGLERRRCDKQ